MAKLLSNVISVLAVDRSGIQLTLMHRVAPGEDLQTIAKNHNQTVDVLAKINGIQKDSKLAAGQIVTVRSELKLENRINKPQLVYDLDSALDIELEDILRVNEMTSPDEWVAGKTILIPVALSK